MAREQRNIEGSTSERSASGDEEIQWWTEEEREWLLLGHKVLELDDENSKDLTTREDTVSFRLSQSGKRRATKRRDEQTTNARARNNHTDEWLESKNHGQH
jgi:hypothetical protein